MHRKLLVIIGTIAAFVSAASGQPAPPGNKPDVTLGSTPDTVVWGYISSRTPPVLRIKSGTTVRIDTMSHQGLTTNADPVTYFGRAGIKPEEVLQDAKDIYAKVPRGKGLGVHVLTGPIYIEGAEPGDALEVRVLDLEFRVPYGVNNTGPGSGVLPDLVPTSSPRVIKTDPQRKVAFLPGGIELPLGPFLGIMAVAPPPDLTKRLDNFNNTPQVSPVSTQPAQEPPPATAPHQEQPTSKLKQIAMTLWRWLRSR
jgi:acetamidase/formamidase